MSNTEKTIRQWFEELPPGLREKAIDELPAFASDRRSSSLIGCIYLIIHYGRGDTTFWKGVRDYLAGNSTDTGGHWQLGFWYAKECYSKHSESQAASNEVQFVSVAPTDYETLTAKAAAYDVIMGKLQRFADFANELLADEAKEGRWK